MTATLIAHLSEVDRRGLHSQWGYSSLFAYCTDDLGYSESEAYFRIQVARIVRRYPEVLDELARGTLTLSVAAVISPVLCSENSATILDRAKGMTKLQAKELVAEVRPKPLVRSGVRRKPHPSHESGPRGAVPQGTVSDESGPNRSAANKAATTLPHNEDPAATATSAVGLGSASRATDRTRGRIEPAQTDAYNFRFSAGRLAGTDSV